MRRYWCGDLKLPLFCPVDHVLGALREELGYNLLVDQWHGCSHVFDIGRVQFTKKKLKVLDILECSWSVLWLTELLLTVVSCLMLLTAKTAFSEVNIRRNWSEKRLFWRAGVVDLSLQKIMFSSHNPVFDGKMRNRGKAVWDHKVTLFLSLRKLNNDWSLQFCWHPSWME